MLTLAEVLSHFKAATKTGKHYRTICPAHPDEATHRSLQISQGDSAILFKCWTRDCAVEDILSAAGLTVGDVSSNGLSSCRVTIDCTFDYLDEQRRLLYQTVKWRPKSFSQRRPGKQAGQWIKDIKGVRRVLYRLPDLVGRPAVLIPEGEKDVETLWGLGLPATTNVCGALQWRRENTDQLVAAGVKRAILLPDFDPPGYERVNHVAQQLLAAHLAVSVCVLPGLPRHGDVSTWLLEQHHTKKELVTHLKQAVPWAPNMIRFPEPDVVRSFQRLHEGHYRWSITPPGVAFEIDYLHRSHGELFGELTVYGDVPSSRTAADGSVLSCHVNVSSLAARDRFAQTLKKVIPVAAESLDCFQAYNDFANQVLAGERQGEPVVYLTGKTWDPPDKRVWTIDGLTLSRRLPGCLFGWRGTGKSYIALYLAGCLMRQGVRVLYVDGELDRETHDERCEQLFGVGGVPDLPYVRCRDLEGERDHLRRIIENERIDYLVLDSITKLARGKLEDSETALTYFKALDRLGRPSLNIAHIPKHAQQNKDIKPQDQQVYGAAQWDQLLRHSWFVTKGDEDDPAAEGGVVLGLYLAKSNIEREGTSRGWRFKWSANRVEFSPCDLLESSLAKHESTRRRLKDILQPDRVLTVEAAAEELGIRPDTVRRKAERFAKVFDLYLGSDGRRYVKLGA